MWANGKALIPQKASPIEKRKKSKLRPKKKKRGNERTRSNAYCFLMRQQRRKKGGKMCPRAWKKK